MTGRVAPATLRPNLLQFGPYFLLGAAVFRAQQGSRAVPGVAVAAVALMALRFWDYDAAFYVDHGRDRGEQLLLLAGLAWVFVWLACRSGWRPGRRDRALGDLAIRST